MTFDVSLKKTDEGYAVWCPALKGCWSQGDSKEEALKNIRLAIREYLIVSRSMARKHGHPVKVRVAAQLPKIPGVSHARAVRALKKAGFWISRDESHTTMENEAGDKVQIPRGNPINAFTMGGIARDAGLSVEKFKALL